MSYKFSLSFIDWNKQALKLAETGGTVLAAPKDQDPVSGAFGTRPVYFYPILPGSTSCGADLVGGVNTAAYLSKTDLQAATEDILQRLKDNGKVYGIGWVNHEKAVKNLEAAGWKVIDKYGSCHSGNPPVWTVSISITWKKDFVASPLVKELKEEPKPKEIVKRRPRSPIAVAERAVKKAVIKTVRKVTRRKTIKEI